MLTGYTSEWRTHCYSTHKPCSCYRRSDNRDVF